MHCRVGMRADFTVYAHNLLESLPEDVTSLPSVAATFVDGECAFGCSNFPTAPTAPSASAAAVTKEQMR